MIRDIMWLDPERPVVYIDDDLGEYLEEMSFASNETVLTEEQFVEFWELVLEWQEEVQK
jgi:hypothetical protein